ncbi:MAG: aldehyde oxidase, partial [Clostridiales bacterium]|nr:aldehyde oxidase [Clostridiales bacterium]
MKQISRPVRKKDAFALLTGKPVYTADIFPQDALTVKLLRSPHAFADIRDIDTSAALKVPGVACVLTYRDVPDVRFTIAGQAVPEWSPYDRKLLDSTVRYIGDPVAIIAAETPQAAEKAMRLIRVTYDVKEPVLDLRKALDNPVLVHPEADWKIVAPFGGDAKRNLCAHETGSVGNAEEKLKECAFVAEGTYHTGQVSQCFMEPFTTGAYVDSYGRMNVISSTQIPFHIRRIVATALQIPVAKVRVVKPRVGGGFGAKQTAVSEIYAAAAAYRTGRPCLIQYTRKEIFEAGSPRHEMEIRVRVGADREGHILAIDHRVLSNTGAYGEHGPTTITLSGRQPTSIYRYAKDIFFEGTVVYTNTVPAGAYRGFGLTQGAFAVESTVNSLAHQMGMDPAEIRRINLLREGDSMGIYNGGEVTKSCRITDCLERADALFDWKERSKRRVMPDGMIRAGGIASAMQGSGIAFVDTATATVRLVEDGSYVLEIGAADMGTGCDTT